jgi:hypothetical protein
MRYFVRHHRFDLIRRQPFQQRLGQQDVPHARDHPDQRAIDHSSVRAPHKELTAADPLPFA